MLPKHNRLLVLLPTEQQSWRVIPKVKMLKIFSHKDILFG